VFGKDIRTLLAISCQKIFFEEGCGSGYYHYGVFESASYRSDMDLAVATDVGYVNPTVSTEKRSGNNQVGLLEYYVYSV
jgi:hypothetical protein